MREENPTLEQLANYTSAIADGAQIRRIKARMDGEKMYDDEWWQPVMDYVRHELLRLAREAKSSKTETL